jgi:phosphate starvation-inducible PhoH-like protein
MALDILKGIDGITTVNFDRNDIVRHRLVREIVDAYDRNTISNKEDN